MRQEELWHVIDEVRAIRLLVRRAPSIGVSETMEPFGPI
jgi:hypothetical protein